MRQTGGGVCRLRTPISRCAFPKEGSVAKSLSYQARRALLQQTVPQYREASPSQKKTLLDVFVAATGYHRTYARWLLNHAEEVQQILHRPRPRQYGPDAQSAGRTCGRLDCRPSRPPKLCSRLHKYTMFRHVCQLDMVRAAEIHAWSSRSEISSCFDVPPSLIETETDSVCAQKEHDFHERSSSFT